MSTPTSLTLRDKLDLIDGWLVEETSDARSLSAILSALRGPDALNTNDAKDKSTNVIRRVAFPKAWERAGGDHTTCGGSRTGWDTWDTADKFESPREDSKNLRNPNERYNGCGEHFTQHVESAAKALGLIPKDGTSV